MDRVTEELKAMTKILEIDLGRHVENADSDIVTETGSNSGEKTGQYGRF